MFRPFTFRSYGAWCLIDAVDYKRFAPTELRAVFHLELA
jgi:hypothetical protein